MIRSIFHLIGCIFLIGITAFGLVYFECSPSSCTYGCSVSLEVGSCQQQSTCCGYCTSDNGHTKEWCCLSCGEPKMV